LALSFIIHYHTAVWNQTKDCSQPPCIFTWDNDEQPSISVVAADQMSSSEAAIPGGALVFSDESTHPMGLLAGNISESLDASGFKIDAANTIYFPNGTRIFPYGSPVAGQKEEDVDGNQITFNTTITDTVGRVIPDPHFMQNLQSTTDFSGCTGPQVTTYAWLWQVPGSNGSTNTFKFCFTNVHIFTHHFATDDGAHIEPNQDLAMMQSIVLPDNTAFTFAYSEPDANGVNWGDLVKVTLPAGGSISYTWDHPVGCQVPFGHVGSTSARLLTRTVDANDGTGPHTWNYSISQSSAKVTDPLGNDTVHTFTDFNTSCSLFETQTQYFSGSSTGGSLLKTVTTDYSWAPNPNFPSGGPPQPAMNVVPIRKTTTWPNGLVRKSEFDYDSGFTFTTAYNTSGHGIYGKQVAVREYDFGSGSPGPLLESTSIVYAWQSNGNYLTFNILNGPSSVTTNNGAGTQVAQVLNYYDETALGSSGVTVSRDTSPANGSFRGHLTTTKHWLNGSAVSTASCPVSVTNGYLTQTAAYLDSGMVSQSSDACGNATTLQYAVTPYAGAYLTSACNALNQCTTKQYNLNPGLISSVTDPNNQTTNYTYDNIGRLTNVTYPDQGQTNLYYPNPTTVEKKQLLSSATNTWTDQYFYFDGLGRANRNQRNTPSGNAYVDTAYDALGRVASVSNPYFSTSDTTYGVTQTAYDALGRPTTVTKQDGGISTASYTGTCATMTDEAGKQRKTCTDALGRLTVVWEDPNGLNYETDYQYDALGNLLRVDQKGSAPNDSTKWRTRTFTYDSLDRLLTAYNPESGTITYTYDANGNVLSKTDARGITVSYSYDALDRVTQKTFSNGDVPEQYMYDQSNDPTWAAGYAVGRLVRAGKNGGHWFSYDALGRVTSTWQCLPSDCTHGASVGAAYNLGGELVQLTYPDGAKVTYTPDSAGRMVSAVDSGNNINYVTGASYAPGGGLTAFVSGQSGTVAGITNGFMYNNRLQPCRTTASSTGQLPTTCTNLWGNLLDLEYRYNLGAGDNGNVTQIVNWRDQSRAQTFTYDSLNRLTSAQNAGTDCSQTTVNGKTEYWGNSYGYDAWGNLLQKTITKCNAENLSIAALANNQLSGYSYDAAGNMTHDATGNHNYTYDAHSQITQVDGGASSGGATYTYDAEGQRLRKDSAGSPSTEHIYFNGQIVAEKNVATGAWTDYVFFDGERVARKDPGNAVSYYFSDHLKTTDIVTDAQGNILNESDFYPWGGELQFLANDSNHYKFTGKERDAETGLDYFDARYYSNGLGRFITPDWSAVPVPVPYADLTDPQTLNLYGYVRGLPTTRADLDGHDWWDEVKGTAIGTVNFVGHAAKGIAISAIPVYGPKVVADGIVSSVTVAAQDYYNKGASGVMNEVLDQGPQGAMEIVTEAVLTGGLAASGRVDGVMPESFGAPDANVVVRGGQSEMPAAGTKFSGSQGATVEDAAQGVPHGTIRESTAGEIRKAGGSVRSKPELTRNGTMNKKHVNVKEGTNKPSTFSQPKPNPVPKKDRIDGGK